MRKAGAEGLVRAALQVIAHDGLADASLRAIAQAAGVSEPAIYRHFGSKRDLLGELFRRCAGSLYTYLDEGRSAAEGALAQVAALAGAFLDFALDYPEEYAFIAAVHQQQLRHLNLRAERLPKDLFVEAIEALQAERGGSALPASLAAGTIIGAVMGVVLFWGLGQAGASRQACRDHAVHTATCVALASCGRPHGHEEASQWDGR